MSKIDDMINKIIPYNEKKKVYISNKNRKLKQTTKACKACGKLDTLDKGLCEECY